MQLFYVLPFFLLIAILNPIHAVDYLVINNATATLGGAQFGQEIGVQMSNTPRKPYNLPQSLFGKHSSKQNMKENTTRKSLSLSQAFLGYQVPKKIISDLAQTISKITLVMSGLKLLESYIMKLHVFGNGLATMKPQ